MYFITSAPSKDNEKKLFSILQKEAQGNDFFDTWTSQKENEEHSRRNRPLILAAREYPSFYYS